ncbi:MAG: hypothetical protein NE334_05995 [Lentisphaeraceae bacterium]|nr:hypothetical protein [Lentisphaeraceae bacterium]
MRVLSLLFLLSCSAFAQNLKFEKNQRLILLGGAFTEVLMDSASFEYQLQKNYPSLKLQVRNMSWSGDEVTPEKPVPYSALRGGPQKKYWKDDSFNSSKRPFNFGSFEKHLGEQKGDIYCLFFGMSESFDGLEKLSDFRQNYLAYLKKIKKVNPQAKFILFSPIAQEKPGQYFPEVKERNKVLAAYTEVISQVAFSQNLDFVNLFKVSLELKEGITHDGITPTVHGMDRLMNKAVGQLGFKSFPVDEDIRNLLVNKNTSFFHRWRPLNLEYIVGTRSVHTSKPVVYLTNDLDYKKDFGTHDQIIKESEEKVWQKCSK